MWVISGVSLRSSHSAFGPSTPMLSTTTNTRRSTGVPTCRQSDAHAPVRSATVRGGATEIST
jgi:hypothetical protein